MSDADAPPSASALQRRLRRARLDTVLFAPANAVLLGGSGIAAAACYAAELRGLLNPGTWPWALAAGVAVLAVKVALDLRDRRGDDLLWRGLLARVFGDSMREDPEVTRQARMAIEFRVRLAMAETRAPRALRRQAAPVLARLDHWLDGIVRLAQDVASLRAEARFQAALGSRSRQRSGEIGAAAQGLADAARAARLQQAAGALEAHARASAAFDSFVADALLQLEAAVGAFGAATSDLMLALRRGGSAPGGLDATIGREAAAVEAQIAAIDRRLPPPAPPGA